MGDGEYYGDKRGNKNKNDEEIDEKEFRNECLRRYWRKERNKGNFSGDERNIWRGDG